MCLKNELETILEYKTGHLTLKNIKTERGDGFEFNFVDNISKSRINYNLLTKFCELFGTKEVAAVETLDGLSYTIQLYNPTKNVAELNELVGAISGY